MPKPNATTSTPCACTTVKKVSRALGRRYDAALAGSNLSVTQFAVLRRIQRLAGEPLSHVARELEMDRTTLYRAVSPMARDGWLTLTEGMNARSRSAALTPKGERLLSRASQRCDGLNARVISAFGRGKWEALLGELTRLAACAEAAADV